DKVAAAPPPRRTSRPRTRRLMAMKAASREPQSRAIAAFTVSEVVSGPGVSSQGSRGWSLIRRILADLAAAENHEAGEHVAGHLAVALGRPVARGVKAEHAVDEAGEAGNEGGHGCN